MIMASTSCPSSAHARRARLPLNIRRATSVAAAAPIGARFANNSWEVGREDWASLSPREHLARLRCALILSPFGPKLRSKKTRVFVLMSHNCRVKQGKGYMTYSFCWALILELFLSYDGPLMHLVHQTHITNTPP